MAKNLLFVLLADDDEDDFLFFKDAFDGLRMQIKLEHVYDGAELLKYLTHPDVILPDILFLDLNMPKKSGHECLVEIKKNERLKDLIVAIYSTSSAEEDIERAFINGAHVYIQKPRDFSSLKRIISEVMSINWQYHTTGLDRTNFILRLK